ncbi:unnamed protein product [Protopolystoma xenopodis]|uniref:Ig-like domain-containing protein n=1 Tax=Protopolystoma xenopodis TaxID=117903 RepID=A0A3S5FDU8_9PLAT|nr:unnamed protein product [Protopolystoma xenopodis]
MTFYNQSSSNCTSFSCPHDQHRRPPLTTAPDEIRPHFLDLPTSVQFVPPGGRLKLRCRAAGKPMPTVAWYKDRTELRSSLSAPRSDADKFSSQEGVSSADANEASTASMRDRYKGLERPGLTTARSQTQSTIGERLRAPGIADIEFVDLTESLNVSCVASSSMGHASHNVQIIVKGGLFLII